MASSSSSNNNQSDVSKHHSLNDRFTPIGDKNLWAEFTGLARQYEAVNLGQVTIINLENNHKIQFKIKTTN
jgi:hypothetical protein